jgi:hypothetical protein
MTKELEEKIKSKLKELTWVVVKKKSFME